MATNPTILAIGDARSRRSGTVLLVRNAVEHDARVLRCAKVAAALGDVLVIGAAPRPDAPRELTIDGVRVLRLAPGGATRARLWRLAGRAAQPSSTGTATLGSRSPLPPPLRLRMRLRRTAVGLSWIARAARLTVRARPALVHANDWNTMWAGLAAKLATGCALVYDSHELWADRNGRWEYRPWLIACEWLFVRFADAVTTTSPGHARALAGRYRIATPVVIRNLPERGVDPVAPEPVLAYVGGIMPGRGIEQAIDALALLPGVRIRATGPGAPRYRAALLARAELRGVSDRLELRSPVAPREVVDAIAGAAAGLCLIQPVCRSYELSLPNKLFEYLAAGVPVLCSDLPVMACVIGANGLGEIVDQADPEAIAAGARRLLCADRDLRDRVLRFGRAHLWEDEAGKLARLYGSLVRRRPSGPAART